MIIPTVLYLLSFLLPALPYYIACLPVLVYGNLQVWRIFTGIWCHPQLLMLLFALFSYVQHGCREEKRIGTVAFFFRFQLVAAMTLILYTAVCGITGFGVTQPAAGLWSMLFADLVIEAMVNPDQPRPLCCLPIMLKAKYYPWVLIIIFSLIFGLQLDFWCGLAVGYMWHYGLLSKCAIGNAKAAAWEQSFPFKYWADKEYFVTAGGAEENSIGGGSGPVGTVLNGNGGGSNFPMPGGGQAAAASNSSAATFKSFSGTGHSLGGGSSAPSGGVVNAILSRNNASASRGRSTPETRANGEQPKRGRNLAESKLVQNSNRSSSQTTVTGTVATEASDDLEGHPIGQPQDARNDKSGGADYQNLTTDSNE